MNTFTCPYVLTYVVLTSAMYTFSLQLQIVPEPDVLNQSQRSNNSFLNTSQGSLLLADAIKEARRNSSKKGLRDTKTAPLYYPQLPQVAWQFLPLPLHPFSTLFLDLGLYFEKKRVFSNPSGKELFPRFFVLWVRDQVLIKRILILKLCRSNMSQKSKSLVKTRSLEKVWGP